MIELKISFGSYAEAAIALSALAAMGGQVKGAPATPAISLDLNTGAVTVAKAQDAPKTPAKPSAAAAGGVTYLDVKKAAAGIAKTNRDALVAIFASFGVKTGTELTEAQWPQVIAAIAAAEANAPLV